MTSPRRYLSAKRFQATTPMSATAEGRLLADGDPYELYHAKKFARDTHERLSALMQQALAANYERVRLSHHPTFQSLLSEPLHTPESHVWNSIGRPRPAAAGRLERALRAVAETMRSRKRGDLTYRFSRWLQPGLATACALNDRILGGLPKHSLGLCVTFAGSVLISVMVGLAAVVINPFLVFAYISKMADLMTEDTTKIEMNQISQDVHQANRQAMLHAWGAIGRTPAAETRYQSHIRGALKLTRQNGPQPYPVRDPELGNFDIMPIDPVVAARWEVLGEHKVLCEELEKFVRPDLVGDRWVRLMASQVDTAKKSLATDCLAAMVAGHQRNDEFVRPALLPA